MNDLQIFSNPEFGQVRTVELDGRIDQLKSSPLACPRSTRSWPTSSPPRKRSDHYEEAYSSRPFYPIHECP